MTSSTTTLDTTHEWTVSASFGINNFYVRCSDAQGSYNIDDYTITFTRQIQAISPIQGPIISPITKPISIDDPSNPGTEVSVDDVSIGNPFVPPAGGLCIKLADGVCLNIFGDNATLHSISEIDPNKYKVLLCNQSYVSAYEINITVDDAYLCFDTSKADLKAISVYTFNGDWKELDEIIYKNGKVCGKIKSSPYMIAGFKTSATQESALNEIERAQRRIERSTVDTTQAEQILEQARQAYFNCEYDKALELAEEAIKLIPILLPEIPIWIWIGVGALLMGGYYTYKHPDVLKFKKRKSKRKRKR